MESIRAWLESLGLESFSDAFVDNGVDLELLPDIDNDDLKDMGVSRVADRKRILKAIAELCQSSAGARVPSIQSPERRQLSVLFCDLVGSTALSTEMDPEDLRELLRIYQDTVATVVMDHQGHVADYRGDGILAYFGWPKAHEDQAQNAARAALDAVNAVSKLTRPTGEALAAKASIATGQVVVGDLETDTGFQAGAISGETPNRAARLESEAAPGQVLIDTSTCRLLGSSFQVESLGERDFKGLPTPIDVWLVTDEVLAESRFAAQRSGRLTPFIGREHEEAIITGKLEQSRSGAGQAVGLKGEAGIGKSRLIQRTKDLARERGFSILQYQCAPSFTSSTYYPFVQQLGFAAGFAGGDTNDTRLGKLETLVMPSTRPKHESCALLAAMLQLPTEERYPPVHILPDQLLHEMGGVLIEQLDVLQERRPVLMIIEDIHWADLNSLALIERVAESLAAKTVLLLATFRPEAEAPWRDQAHTHTLQLERLDRERSRALALRVSGQQNLPDFVLDQILDKTDGVPLFLEEFVKTVLEGGHVHRGTNDADAGWISVAIPATLKDSLAARLDRLSPAREIAQIGAVIGRDFDYEVLAAVAPIAEPALRDDLQQLVDAELIYRHDSDTGEAYQFKHALVRDAAYDSMLRARRREIHRDVADAIESRTPQVAAARPELLAQHFDEAGLALRAIPLWLSASQAAAGRGAYPDALHHARRGLTALEGIGGHAEFELALVCAHASATIPTTGYAHPEVAVAVERIVELSESVPDSPELVGSLFWVSVARWTSGDVLGASAYCDRIVRIADSTDHLPLRVAARGYVGSLQVHLPDFQRSRENLGFVLEHYSPDMHAEICRGAGQDLGVNGHSWDAVRLALEGYPVQALAKAHRTVDLAREQNHAFSFPLVLLMACWVAHILRDQEQARTWAHEAISYCEATQNNFWIERARQNIALAELLHGNLESGVDTLENFLQWTRKVGARLEEATTTSTLALAYEAAGNQERADELVREGQDFIEHNPEFIADACFLLNRGYILERRGRIDAAREDYLAVHDSCGQVGAHLFQLRAATRLLQVAAGDHDRTAARRRLSSIYEKFSEGYDFLDLVDARAMLETPA